MWPKVGIAHAQEKLQLQERIDTQELGESTTAPEEVRNPEEQMTDLATRIGRLPNQLVIIEEDGSKVIQAGAGFSGEAEDGSDLLVRVTLNARYRPVDDKPGEMALDSVSAIWEALRLRDPLFADETLSVSQLRENPQEAVRLLGLIGQSIEGAEERASEIATDELIRRMNETTPPPHPEDPPSFSSNDPLPI